MFEAPKKLLEIVSVQPSITLEPHFGQSRCTLETGTQPTAWPKMVLKDRPFVAFQLVYCRDKARSQSLHMKPLEAGSHQMLRGYDGMTPKIPYIIQMWQFSKSETLKWCKFTKKTHQELSFLFVLVFCLSDSSGKKHHIIFRNHFVPSPPSHLLNNN